MNVDCLLSALQEVSHTDPLSRVRVSRCHVGHVERVQGGRKAYTA
jgi:hypothetical protein